MLVDNSPAPSLAYLPRPNSPATNGTIADGAVSSYLQYLPAPYQTDAFLGHFLLIFEAILGPIEQTIDMLMHYFDPRIAPAELLPYLAAWVGIELDENWTLQRRRELIYSAVTLYRWRGTRRGLREHLRVYTGRPPLIVENFAGLRLDQDGALGETAALGEPRPNWLQITVLAEPAAGIEERVVRQIIEFQKPAHVGYSLEIRPANGRLVREAP
jgi:phage tail-like protein